MVEIKVGVMAVNKVDFQVPQKRGRQLSKSSIFNSVQFQTVHFLVHFLHLSQNFETSNKCFGS